MKLFGFGKKNKSGANEERFIEDKKKDTAESSKDKLQQPEFLLNGTVLEKYNGSGGVVHIPDGVTDIAYIAFEDSNIESLTIPKSVEGYHSGAFRIPKVKKIITSNLIPQDILGQCLVLRADFDREDLMIPANDQMELEEIVVEEGNEIYAAVDGVLYDKSMKKLLHCPPKKRGTVVIAQGTERIRPRAFAKCRLIEHLVIADSVKHPVVFGDLDNLQTVSLDEETFSPLCEYFPNSDKIEDARFHHDYHEQSGAQEGRVNVPGSENVQRQICKKCGHIRHVPK